MARFSFHKPKDALPYARYQPEGEAPTGGWPLILFLHGAGERGSDGKEQASVGIGPAILEQPQNWPAVVLMPQCPANEQWSGRPLQQAYELLEQIERQHQTDRERVYLTGLSMGGAGSWGLGALHPERFAAIAPICGTADPFTWRMRLDQVPIWNFHGSADEVVPVSFSRALADAMAKAGNSRAIFTEYAAEKHDVWNRVYREPAFIAWLFAQRRRTGTPDLDETLAVPISLP